MNEMLAGFPLRGDQRARGGSSAVFEALREDILGLRLVPGTILSRAELQDRFGLSSTPIRDALIRLQEEALVDIFPQHATRVTLIDIARAHEAQFLRRSVEIEIVGTLALKPDAVAIERLRSAMRQQAAFAELAEFEAFHRADQAFHRIMFEAANVAELWGFIRRRSGHIERLRRLNLPVEGKMREVVRDHTAIVDAIAQAAPEAAQAAMRWHLSRSLDFANRLRESYPHYFVE
jgi:GntR family transcriptional regulator, rspAB operon transcriptional repressor